MLRHNFTTQGTDYSAASQRVYTKLDWADDWVLQDGFHCDRCNWAISPDMPSATLFWRYGMAKFPHQGEFARVARRPSASRFYVKILIGEGNEYDRVWIGTVEAEQHQPAGSQIYDATGTVPAGEQIFTAYGLELLLDQIPLLTCPTTNGEIHRALDFNEGQFANRDPLLANDVFTRAADAIKWNTRTIVKYLVSRMPNATGPAATALPWQISNAELAKLPNWDEPTVSQHGQRIRALMNQLLPRQRLLSWFIGFTQDPDVTKPETAINIGIRTHTAVDIQVGSDAAHKIPAAAHQFEIIQDRSASVQFGWQSNTMDTADVVHCYGARATATFSVKLGLMARWPAAAQTRYNAGYSAAADYAPAEEIADRRKQNERVRQHPKNEMVFRLWKLPDAFDGTVPDLFNLLASRQSLDPANKADPDASAADRKMMVTADTKLLPSLLLRAHENYSGTRIRDGLVPDNPQNSYLNPYILVPIPKEVAGGDADAGTDREWQFLHRLPLTRFVNDEEREFTFSGQLRIRDRWIEIDIKGAPQHAIAKGTFTPLPDDDAKIPQLDWREFVLTLAIEVDSYATGTWPDPDGATPAAGDSVREIAIYPGEQYRRDFVVKGTALGPSDADLSLTRVASGGWVRNDEQKLQDIARQAYAWYSLERKAVSFNSVYYNPVVTGTNPRSISVGDFMLQYVFDAVDGSGDPDPVNEPVNSVVTWMEYRSQRAVSQSGNTNPKPTFAFSTAFANLDIKTLIPTSQ